MAIIGDRTEVPLGPDHSRVRRAREVGQGRAASRSPVSKDLIENERGEQAHRRRDREVHEAVRPGGADPEVHAPRRGVDPGDRRAHPDPQGQAAGRRIRNTRKRSRACILADAD
ncbi:MAG: hypothetical protein MZU95_16840 [Desulfomicrobium escambiense]|nr:hypothetical protein [Desulfomicrobium escambiense]